MQTQTNDARHKQKTKTDAAYTETKKHRERAAQKSDQGSLKIWCDDDDQGKQQEKGLIELAKKWKIPFLTYSSDQLNAVEGDFSNSDFVKQTVGTSNVCERSAYLGSRCGKKRMKKTARDGMTMAVYEEVIAISF